MKPEQFCYWLQGFFELNGNTNTLSPSQIRAIENHLGLVFLHTLDPENDASTTTSAETMNLFHNPDVPTPAGALQSSTVYRC